MAKKWFIAALGVLLLVAFTAPVMAETQVTFKGSYRVRYFYDQNLSLSSESDQESQSNYFDQRFRIEPTFVVSDSLSLIMRINAINGSRWGDANGAYGEQATYAYSGALSYDGFDVERCFMRIVTNFGTFMVGRTVAGTNGLAGLAYNGGRFAMATGLNESDPFDGEYATQRIIYQYAVSNFRVTAVYEKMAEQDWQNAGNQAAIAVNPGWDDDTDGFALVPQYAWATGQANMTLCYMRNHSRNEANFWATGVVPMDINLYYVDLALVQAFGLFTMHLEGQYRWGTMDMDRWIVPSAVPDMDFQGWGIYLDGIYNFGPGEVGLLFMYTQGADPYATASDVQQGQLSTGADYEPFYVAYDRGPLSANTTGWTRTVANSSNHWNLGLWCDYDITEAMMLHAALGYFQINETPTGWSDNFGWEFDIGFNWQLMEGLRYSTIFGYFLAGDYNEAGNSNNEYGNAWGWKNELVLSF